MRFDDFHTLVGRTPVVRFRCATLPSEVRLWIKLEGFNPTGSVKDRACVFLLGDALERSVLQPGMTLLDASSGNMACALAYFGKVLGHRVKVVCSSRLTTDKADFIQFFGAHLVRFGNITMDGNRYCRNELLLKSPQAYCFLDQLHNWASPQAAFETMGPEIVQDFPNVAAVAGSLGSGATMYGTARWLKAQGIKAVIVTAEGGVGTKIPGVANFDDGEYVTPFIADGIKEGLFHSRQKVLYPDAVKRTSELSEQGFFVGFQTGAVVQAAFQAIKDLNIVGDVVVISGDAGWKNMDVLKRKTVEA